jgi:MerR family transcriptional regulator, mercuric resistance operon regulatory protein
VVDVRAIYPDHERGRRDGPRVVGLTPYLGTAASFEVMAGLTIGKFAAAEGVGVETVRFYQRRGLLALPERTSGFREYSEADRWRLAFIRRARLLGFTLGEIRELLGPAEARSTDDIIRAAQSKLEAIEEQARELALLRCKLRRLVQVCEHGDGDDCVALRVGGADVNGKERQP